MFYRFSMLRQAFLFVFACALALCVMAHDGGHESSGEAEDPFRLPPKCTKQPLLSTLNCVCYLITTRQITSPLRGSIREFCKIVLGDNRELFKLGTSCSRFVNDDMEIMIDRLDAAATAWQDTCLSPGADPLFLQLPPAMQLPQPSIELPPKCMTKPFNNIARCGCYLMFTGQIVERTYGNGEALAVCRDIIVPNKFIVNGGTHCKRFVARKTGQILVKRLQFRASIYLKTCLDPDGRPPNFKIVESE